MADRRTRKRGWQTIGAGLLGLATFVSVPMATEFCGTTVEDTSPVATCEGTFKDRAIFLSFPDVIAVAGDSLLPSYADDVVSKFRSFVDTVSLGKHRMDYETVKRTGSDSIYVWVMSMDSGDYTSWSALQDELHAMIEVYYPDWDLDLDLPIYYLGGKPACCQYVGVSNGTICNPGSNYIRIRYGGVCGPTYCLRPEAELLGLTVHEYGHQLGVNHLSDSSNGEGSNCFGGYYACYAAMDRQLFTGCDEYVDHDGLLPYHPFNLIRFGWLTPVVVTTTTYGIRLRDVRIHGDVIKIPVETSTYQEYFLLVNHQKTLYDDILNGRGVLIWHIKEIPGNGPCPTTTDRHIIDLEHPLGLFDPDTPTANYCPDLPHIPDTAQGVDTLNCESTMLSSAFYGGLAPGLSQTPQEFASETNPSSDEYTSTADDRLDAQSVASGMAIRNFEVLPDLVHGGKYIIEFDIIFD